MTRAEFRRWAEQQPRGRYERVAGEIVATAPERVAHVRVKAAIWLALRTAIAAASAPCEAFGHGMTVEIGDDTEYEPDALVTCGPRLPADAIAAPTPVVVVEVLSPSTRAVDTGTKFSDYLRVPSIRHTLVVRADRPAVTHHRRADDGGIETRLLTAGPLLLDPPGLTLAIEDFYP